MVTTLVGLPGAPIQVTEINPAIYFEAVYQAFQQAEEAVGGPFDRFYRMAGYTIRLRFAGPALVPCITPALEHLATEPTSYPALTLCLWDSISTHTKLPRPPWLGYDAFTSRGDVRGFSNDQIHTAYHLGADALNMLDTSRNLAIYCTRDAHQLPFYESGSPLRIILQWWFRRYGRQFVHAGAVGTAKGGVLLAGRSGSGKSTTTLTCLNSELVYASDDYCLIAADPVPYVYSTYNSAKVHPDNLDRVPHLESAVSNAGRLDMEKALIFLQQHYPEKLVSGFPIRALLLPRVTGRLDTTLTPAPRIDGLRALSLTTIGQLAGAGRAALQMINQFVKQVPCYHLELGTDLAQIPQVVLGLISKE